MSVTECDDLHKRLAFSQGQFSVVMFNMQALQADNSDLRQQNLLLLKEKESFEAEKKKAYKLGLAAGQKIQNQQKPIEKVIKKADHSNVSTAHVVKAKEEVKLTRNLRWSEVESDDELSVSDSVDSKIQNGKTFETLNVDEKASFLENERIFLVFLEANFDKIRLDKPTMIMDLGEKESNIFCKVSFVPFYTEDAIKQTKWETNQLTFNFAEIFNLRNKKYELILRGIPNVSQIRRLV